MSNLTSILGIAGRQKSFIKRKLKHRRKQIMKSSRSKFTGSSSYADGYILDEWIVAYFRRGFTYEDMVYLLNEQCMKKYGPGHQFFSLTNLKKHLKRLNLSRYKLSNGARIRRPRKEDVEKALRDVHDQESINKCEPTVVARKPIVASAKYHMMKITPTGDESMVDEVIIDVGTETISKLQSVGRPLSSLSSSFSSSSSSPSSSSASSVSASPSASPSSLKTFLMMGPNYIWEVISFERMSDYGFTISGCVDQYSCRIIWLEITTSTFKDPNAIMEYYLNAVEEAAGCPTFLQSDLEIVNGMMSAAHCCLRTESEGNCHVRGRSNDRHMIGNLELWCHEWIKIFEKLASEGAYTNGNLTHSSLLWFAFVDLMKSDLRVKRDEWNSTVYRKQIPDQLYRNPAVGFLDQKKPFALEELDHLRDCSIVEINDELHDKVINHCKSIVDVDQSGRCRSMPSTKEEASKLYMFLYLQFEDF